MTEVTRVIGLSLGADVDWPIAFEEILRRFDPRLRLGDDVVSFDVERVTIEPFDLRAPNRYDVLLDRLTHWYHTSREWIKKAVLMDDLYVFNNPFSIQSMEKHSTYAAMMRLGMPVPDTWMVPPKAYEPRADLQVTLERYARGFDVAAIGKRLGYPLFIKPYDGGGWVGVSRADDPAQLMSAYEHSGTRVLHLQQAVQPYDLFVRCVAVGPQVKIIRYDPGAPLHQRYVQDYGFITAAEARHLEDVTLTINAFFGWDFNSCESLRRDAVFYPIDFANCCPDSQVTSLHYFFPWLVTAKLRWALFIAATRRRMRINLDFAPYFEIAAGDGTYEEKLAGYAKLARRHFDEERFWEFCAAHLEGLDEAAWEFFGTDRAREAVRLKVEARFPPHEVDEFTEHFWHRIQTWRGDAAAGRDELRVGGAELARTEEQQAGLAESEAAGP